jgi:hypothetical protein
MRHHSSSLKDPRYPFPFRLLTLILLITGWHGKLLKTLHEFFFLSIIICILLSPAFSGVSLLLLLLKARESGRIKPRFLVYLWPMESSPSAKQTNVGWRAVGGPQVLPGLGAHHLYLLLLLLFFFLGYFLFFSSLFIFYCQLLKEL